ncbi:alpha/beta hydrolase [Sphingomicrobium nitratireducens]|uniref:alpha/beta hydrolase n=1 Tax=Sphingomicrobium nitratireducens TaxID=2964666 RepID=UPI0022403D57|nr:alpha/beta hydrolase-fold protein [Sphingomicrobium nitratireducens]
MLRMILAALAALTATSALADPLPLTIGEQHVVQAMDVEREINVVLPLSYGEDETRRYPVVYMLDGGVSQDLMMQVGVARWTQMWGRTEEFILVGIETKDRQRELLPPTSDQEALDVWPTAGESALFRAFIKDKVLPKVAGAYRTDGRDFLVGESAAGHFVVETLLASPALFDGYVAISPSLWWEEMLLARKAEADGAGTPPLFISIENEGETMDEGVRRVVAVREKAGAKTCFADRPDLTHGIAYHALLPGALQFLLPGPEPLPEEWGMVTGCAQ